MPPKQPRVRAQNRDSAEPRITDSGRKVWDHWGPKACYNRSKKIRPDELHCHAPCRRAYKPRPQNKTNPWFMALKEFNKDRPTWTIPKRGEGKKPLPDYNKVMQMKEKFEWKQVQERNRREQQEAEDDIPLSQLVKARASKQVIPKRGEAQQAANLRQAAINAERNRREREKAHAEAAHQSAMDEAARRKRLMENAKKRAASPKITERTRSDKRKQAEFVAARSTRSRK